MNPYGSERLWYWIGMGILALGGFGIVLKARGKARDTESTYVFHMFVCFVAALNYLLMALDQTRVDIVVESRHLYLARYLDWSITTPLLLLALSDTALGELRRRAGLVVGLVLADVAMIAAGLAAGLSHVQGSKVTWYIVSCMFQVSVYALVWGPLRREANNQTSPQVATMFTKDATFLSVLWIAYPIVWVFAPQGFRLYDAAWQAFIFMALDITAKVFYGFYALSNDDKLVPHAAHYRPLPEPIGTLQPDATAARGNGGYDRASERVTERRDTIEVTRR